MSNVPEFRRCAKCDQVITRRPIFVNQDWHCRHCGKGLQ